MVKQVCLSRKKVPTNGVSQNAFALTTPNQILKLAVKSPTAMVR
jgi:hypothetical protein